MKYEDIIYYKYNGSKRKNKMSLSDRSAQFAPFQSLDGYTDDVKETERITKEEIYLDESSVEEINNKIKYIYDNNLFSEITYFVKDKYKSGGNYKKINGYIKKIDLIEKQIILKDNTKLDIKNIINIE